MNGFNKVTSFILGLIVVVVFLLVFGSRIRVTDRLLAFKNDKVTPTPTRVVSITPLPTSGQATPTPKKAGFFESLFGRKTTPLPTSGQATPKPTSPKQTAGAPTASTGSGQAGTSVQGVSQIPNTGAPTILLPALLSALGMGFFLRKKS